MNSTKLLRVGYRAVRLSSNVPYLGNICMPIHNVRQLSSDSSNHIYTIPNMITATRIASSPFLALAIVNDMKTTALFGCVAFAFTDWLDGYLAKKLNQKTNLGAILDPLADKCMVTALVAGLSYQGLLPIALSAVIVGRDVFLMAATFAARAMTRPKGSPFFDTNKTATFVIIPSSFSKANTGLQFLLLSATLCNFAFGFPTLVSIDPLWWITGTTTIMSGVSYLDGSGMKKIESK